MSRTWHTRLAHGAVHAFREYGMLGVLALLCVLFSVLTLSDQSLTGQSAASALRDRLSSVASPEAGIIIVCRATAEDSVFALSLRSELERSGLGRGTILAGEPTVIRERLASLVDSLSGVQFLAALPSLVPVIAAVARTSPAVAAIPVITPPSQRWPTFLLGDNLRNVANQIAVIAIVAVGMTMVIIAGGIDLSVGSLIALSAVLTASMIQAFGGVTATPAVMMLSGAAAICLCGATGLFSGVMITSFRVPPFIATLAMMQVAAGFAYIISAGRPIYQVPESFIVLGRGADPWLRIPYAVLLMVVLYVAGHLIMSRTTLGRYVYAVGGNSEAARLAGIRVGAVQLTVYTISAMLAGLGGVLLASQLRSGAPTYGLGYELHVIAAVVVGGTSLSGGEGRILGTLIGALVIGVIQNGMNLTNVESYTQKVVLGLVILAAVLLDQLKQRGLGVRGWFKTVRARETE
ncbi:MAG: ABC transporter permease [Candidatus Zixiibacteriota bacterium]